MARATEALRDATLILVGHGAGGRAAIVERHARTIRRGGTFAAVRTCSLQDGDGLDRTLAGARGENAYILPVLMADGFTMRILSARIAEHAAGAVLCRPVGTLPGLADLLAEQALRTAAERGWSPAETAVLVAAHGTARNPGSARIAEAHAERIRRSGRFAAVEAGFLDQAPTIEDVRRALAGNCVVTGLFVECGAHGERDVPMRLAPFERETPYAGPVGSCPGFADLLVEQVMLTLASQRVA